MNILLLILYIVIGVILFVIIWLSLIKIVRRFAKFPAPAFIGRLLDSGYRRRIQPPDKVIECSGIREGMQVLEVGCGSGAFTTLVARAVGPKGKVYALDIQEDMLQQLRTKLSSPQYSDIKNIDLINKSAYDLPFADNSLDLVYMVTVLQEIPDRQRALMQIKSVLKAGGILAVTELFPDPDYPWKSTTIKICEGAGFILDKVSGSFFNYTIRFKKP